MLAVALDRFASVGASSLSHMQQGPAVVVIRPTLIEWPCLCLNVNATSSKLFVELLPVDGRAFGQNGTTGEAIDGFSQRDFDAVAGVDLRWGRCATWHGQDLSSLVGQLVHIKFLLQHSELYAFAFRQSQHDCLETASHA